MQPERLPADHVPLLSSIQRAVTLPTTAVFIGITRRARQMTVTTVTIVTRLSFQWVVRDDAGSLIVTMIVTS